MKYSEKSVDAIFSSRLSRRNFLATGAVLAAACLLPRKAVAAMSNGFFEERTLQFYNTHTDEQLKTVYWDGGAYVPQALTDINHILRDHRTGAIKEIDTRLLDLLFALGEKMEKRPSFPYHFRLSFPGDELASA